MNQLIIELINHNAVYRAAPGFPRVCQLFVNNLIGYTTQLTLVPPGVFLQFTMAAARVTLEWKTFEPTIKNTFQNLYTDKTLTDVTLACDGNKQILGHKVVLSSCSIFFKNILAMNRNPQPLIYLQGVNYDDIVLLKRFMYLGEATVEEANVKNFMTLSKKFLNKVTDEKRPEQKYTDLNPGTFPLGMKDIVPDDSQPGNTKLDLSKTTSVETVSCTYCSFTASKKLDLKNHLRTEHKETKISCKHCDLKFDTDPGYKSHKMMKHTDPDKIRLLICEHCSYSTKRRGCLSVHMKKHNGKMILCDQCDFKASTNHILDGHQDSKHGTTEYKCETCDYTGQTKRALKFHNDKDHRGIRYFCSSCDYKATKTGNLRSHERTIHAQ